MPTCKQCGKELIRKQYATRMESPARLEKRMFCNNRCQADYVKSHDTPLQKFLLQDTGYENMRELLLDLHDKYGYGSKAISRHLGTAEATVWYWYRRCGITPHRRGYRGPRA